MVSAGGTETALLLWALLKGLAVVKSLEGLEASLLRSVNVLNVSERMLYDSKHSLDDSERVLDDSERVLDDSERVLEPTSSGFEVSDSFSSEFGNVEVGGLVDWKSFVVSFERRWIDFRRLGFVKWCRLVGFGSF